MQTIQAIGWLLGCWLWDNKWWALALIAGLILFRQ